MLIRINVSATDRLERICTSHCLTPPSAKKCQQSTNQSDKKAISNQSFFLLPSKVTFKLPGGSTRRNGTAHLKGIYRLYPRYMMKILLLGSILAMSTNSVLAGGLSAPASPLAPVAMKRKVALSRGDLQVNSFDEEKEGKDGCLTICFKYHKTTNRVQTFLDYFLRS